MTFPHAHILAVILGTTLVFAAGAHAVDGILDIEPNDNCGQATDLGLTGIGSALVVGGEIGNGPTGEGDIDVYQFTLPSATPNYLITVRLVSANPEFDGFLRLFMTENVGFPLCITYPGQIATADDDGDSPDPTLRAHLVDSVNPSSQRIVSIVVAHVGNSGAYANPPVAVSLPTMVSLETTTYALSVEIEPFPATPNSIEPNDDEPTLVESLPFVLTNQFIGDGPNDRDDVDRFKVMLDGPSIVTAEVVPTQLALLDPVLNGISDTQRPDLRIARSRFAVYDKPSVEITVSDPFGRTTGFYNLSIDVEPIISIADDGPYEPNDSILQATETNISGEGQGTFSAYLGDGRYRQTRGDADYYKIVINDAQLLYIDVVPTDETDPVQTVVHLYDPLARRVNWWAADESGEVHVAYKPPPLEQDAATYYVLVSAADDRIPIDPLVPKASYEPDEDLTAFRQADQAIDGGPGDTGAYDVTITVSTTPIDIDGGAPEVPFIPASVPTSPMPRRLFALPSDDFTFSILELDPADGSVIAEIPVPELPISSSTGLAFDGTDVFLLGPGRFANVYRLDPDTGAVLDQMTLWFGSGWFGDLAVLDDWLYLVDTIGAEIYRIPKSLDYTVRRLNIDDIGGFSPAGPIAIAGTPPRIFITRADGQSEILEIDADGLPVAIRALDTPCPCDADIDGDDDVDSVDRSLLNDCFTFAPGFPVLDCVPTDLNCDDSVDELDEAILDCQHNGSGNPPNDGCCPDDLPPFTVRATSLTGQAHALLAADWSESEVYRFDQTDTGMSLGTSAVARPLNAIAGGWVTLFADADTDLDLDILDWGGFQDCFELPMSYTPADPCAVFDWDFDGDVDLQDFNRFQSQMSLLEGE